MTINGVKSCQSEGNSSPKSEVANEYRKTDGEGVTVPAAQIANLKIQYSIDNVTWTDVPAMARTNQVWSFTLTSARYWRVFIPSYSWSYALQTGTNTRDEQAFGTTFFLGKTVPGLKFTTPPANGAAIEASYQLELPFKTSNNLLRFTCSLLLSRGEGS